NQVSTLDCCEISAELTFRNKAKLARRLRTEARGSDVTASPMGGGNRKGFLSTRNSAQRGSTAAAGKRSGSVRRPAYTPRSAAFRCDQSTRSLLARAVEKCQ